MGMGPGPMKLGKLAAFCLKLGNLGIFCVELGKKYFLALGMGLNIGPKIR